MAKGWGKSVARRACGDGPLTEVDLSAMEEVAQAAAAGLTEGALTTLLEQQAQAQALGPEQPCPDCGRPCPVRRRERPLACRDGPVTQSEPVGHCPDCRRDFFPPTSPAAHRRPRLQPRRPAVDR